MYAGAVPFVTPHIYVDMFVVTMFDRMLAKVCRWDIWNILYTILYTYSCTISQWLRDAYIYVHIFAECCAAYFIEFINEYRETTYIPKYNFVPRLR